MKFWVKIIVAFAVVLVLGFSIWAFFFREKDEVVAYNATAELVDYKNSLGIQEKLTDLNKRNYWGDKEDNVIANTSDTTKEILTLRQLCLSTDEVVGYDEDNIEVYRYDTYLVTDELVDEIIAYYLPFMRGDKAESKTKKAVTKSIDDYIDSLKSLNTTLDNLIICQKEIDGTEDLEMEVLKGHYVGLRDKYRTCLNLASEVINSISNYINVSVYDEAFKVDTKYALYDSYSRALSKSTSVELILEPEYASNLYTIKDKIIKNKSSISIFTEEYSEYKFLTNYNNLINNYSDTLNYVFGCTNLVKKDMADNIGLSKVPEKVQDSVVVLLNVLGF